MTREPFDLSDDEQLVRALDGMLDSSEPLPEHLRTYARAIFDFASIDVELAQLTYDSWADRTPVPVRDDGSGERILVYTAADLSIELEASGDGRLAGQLLPAQVCAIRVETPLESTVATLMSDADGSFFGVVPAGRFRLVITTDAGEIATGWMDPPR